ncbi:MAG: sodium-dependent transporter [Bacteroidales bacterium]|nr:sodium-dependent transporter [Bacteroidales bacterium]
MSGKARENFGSRFTVVMALAGSAIGLGNIWRFPYMVGEHGGAAFIIVYVLCSLFIALPIFFSESILGKSTGKDTFGAIESVTPGTKWKNEGYIALLGSFIIVSYYSVVGGWSVDFLVRSLTTGFAGESLEEASGIFTSMTSSVWEPLVTLTVFLGITAYIVGRGIEKGIGLFTKVMMPLLFLMIVVIVIRSCTLPGAGKGIEYLLKPDFSKIDGPAIAAALGQGFFSLSLGVGCVLTYSSYMRKEENVVDTGVWTAVFDTFFAIMASFAIMPAVFAAGLEPSAGPSLVYETLPVIFSKMGRVVPIIFFLSILIAAITSSISMMEVQAAYLVDQKGMSRKKATTLLFCASWIVGALCAVSTRIFSFCDFISSNVFMMIGAFVVAIVVGWKMKKSVVRNEFTNNGTGKGAGAVFPVVWFLVRWVAPIGIVIIAITNLL